MHFTLVTVGSRGDVQPMVAVAHALHRRGHAVRIAAPPDFGDWITGQGIEFAPVGRNIQQYLRDDPGALTGKPRQALRAAKAFFSEQAPIQARDIAAACQGTDAIAWAGLALPAIAVAEALKLPLLGVAYSTCILPSDQHPPPTSGRHGLPPWANRLLWAVHGWVSGRLADRLLNGIRAEAGLPPRKLRDTLATGDFLMAADPVAFPPDPQWPAQVRQGSFIFLDDPRPLDADLQAWLDAGEPPVYVGFGSMSGPGIERIETVVHEALAATGRRCLIGAGWAGLGARGLPAHWRVVGDVPHGKLFPHMAAVVHHGGSGTTAAALRAGVPQVVLPLILDQYHHAHRLWLAGLAPKPISMEKITAPQLADAIDAAIALPPGPRTEATQRLQARNGADDVANALIALAAERLPRDARLARAAWA